MRNLHMSKICRNALIQSNKPHDPFSTIFKSIVEDANLPDGCIIMWGAHSTFVIHDPFKNIILTGTATFVNGEVCIKYNYNKTGEKV